jgi:two-component system, chemotaxis family, protein-glutamate methylesterase/glutaminase
MTGTASPGAASGEALVVIGASAGGVSALQQVIGRLPADLRAAVCVVLHVAPSSPSALARILDRSGPLPCRPAADGDPLRLGEVLVAPPDRHLVIEDGVVRLTLAARENGHRPAVDALFRSAAHTHDGHVIGVVLSGSQDDGSAGLALIKQHGGRAVVQDPADATYEGMPSSAIEHTVPDAVVPADRLAETIVSLVAQNPGAGSAPTESLDDPATGDGEPVTSVCPECGGVLSEDATAGVRQWTCKIGHRYSSRTLADVQARDVEVALEVAIRILEDRSLLLQRMASDSVAHGRSRSAESLRLRAGEASEQAEVIRDALARAAETTLSPLSEDELGP